MVSVEKTDHYVLRFIWVDDIIKEVSNLKVNICARVVFRVSSSPFLLNATIKFHLEKYLEENKDLIRCLLCSTYINNIIWIPGTDIEWKPFVQK